MAFPPAIVTEIRRRAHFKCCLCRVIGIEVHHIVPKADGGNDDSDNAAPLCPSCHETYGANPTKRKFIREARDLWFEICENRYPSDASMLQQVLAVVSNTASKEDVLSIREDISQVLRTFLPSKDRRTFTLPLQPRTPNGQELTIRDLLVIVNGLSSERPYSLTGLLCLKELWPIKDGYRSIYKDFLRRFGETTFTHLAAKALDEIGLDKDIAWLTEEEIKAALQLMSIEAVCMIYVDEGVFEARLRPSGEVEWRKKEIGDEST